MRILIAGGGGLIGSAFAGYLAENGHEVVRLVRREPAADEVRWDPDAGTVDAESWIVLDEIPPIIEHILATPALVGAINVVSPNPEHAGVVTATIGRVLGRRPGRGVPAFLLRLTLGEMADALLLASRRIEPRRLLQSGYRFRYPQLDAALRHQLGAAV
jgi:NAD dependent epimerase/dehydratase family enzyme